MLSEARIARDQNEGSNQQKVQENINNAFEEIAEQIKQKYTYKKNFNFDWSVLSAEFSKSFINNLWRNLFTKSHKSNSDEPTSFVTTSGPNFYTIAIILASTCVVSHIANQYCISIICNNYLLHTSTKADFIHNVF